MKHMFLKSATALFLSIAVLVSACSKGDAGPAGEKGDTGEKGTTGANGSTGKPGTANVIYSEWMDLTFQPADSVTFGAIIDAPKLVDSILQKGSVKVYCNLRTAAEPVIISVPYMDNGAFYGLTDLYINAYYLLGEIYLFSNYTVGTATVPATGEKIRQYRYVLIPGGATARSAVNWNDYASVKKYLGLKD